MNTATEKRKRVSLEQREKLFEFMLNHQDLARNRVGGPDAARRKIELLDELADILNSLGSGSTKTPKLWLKCWQDWRSDVKAKALHIKKTANKTGGGPNPAKPLSELEKNLLQFCGLEMVQGVEGVPDPLEQRDPVDLTPEVLEEVAVEANENSPSTSSRPIERNSELRLSRTKNDPIQASLDRQAAAMEQLAVGVNSLTNKIETGMQDMAAALRSIAAAIEQQAVTVVTTADQ